MVTQQANPFSTKLPPTSTVFGILAGYFVLVVPASFLILRKMKRSELAWFTAPILSLAFAGVLFKSAQGLYSATLSSASQGVLVLQEGSPGATFYGTSQLFFPRGGVYDLKLEGVDRMTAVQRNEGYYYGGHSNELAGFNLVDVGEIKAPELEANNLAFRELSYTQRVPNADWFRIDRVDAHHASVENRSSYLFSGSLANGRFDSRPFELTPGKKVIVQLQSGDQAVSGTTLSPVDPRNFTRGDGRMAIHGSVRGFRPGPQIGQEVVGPSGIAIVAFGRETVQ